MFLYLRKRPCYPAGKREINAVDKEQDLVGGDAKASFGDVFLTVEHTEECAAKSVLSGRRLAWGPKDASTSSTASTALEGVQRGAAGPGLLVCAGSRWVVHQVNVRVIPRNLSIQNPCHFPIGSYVTIRDGIWQPMRYFCGLKETIRVLGLEIPQSDKEVCRCRVLYSNVRGACPNSGYGRGGGMRLRQLKTVPPPPADERMWWRLMKREST